MELKDVISNYKSKGQAKAEAGTEYIQVAKWLEELEQLRKKDFKEREKNVYKEFYSNLVEHLTNKLIDPILGSDYYNEGTNNYTCNEYNCRDLKERFDSLNKINSWLLATTLVSFICCLPLLGILFK